MVYLEPMFLDDFRRRIGTNPVIDIIEFGSVIVPEVTEFGSRSVGMVCLVGISFHR